MGDVVIRDQKPLREHTLKKLLPPDVSVPAYCKLLNARTFLWASEERLNTMLNARAYRGRTHDVLTVDTEGLVGRHRNEIMLSSINSGATSRGAGKRGPDTFKRIDDYAYLPTRAYGGNRVAEVAVDYMIQDIEQFVLLVEKRRGDDTLEIIWKCDKLRAAGKLGRDRQAL